MAWLDFFRSSRVGVASPPPERGKDQEPASGLAAWQREAWQFFEELGEIHYASGFYAHMLSGVRLMVEELLPAPPDPNAQPGEEPEADEWQESTNETYTSVLDGLRNARGGIAQLQEDYGRLRFMQGEAQLVRTLLPAEDAIGEAIRASDGTEYVEHWEMLSGDELTYNKNEKTYLRRRVDSMGVDKRIPETDPDDPLPGTMMAWRFYHRHPRYTGMADCSMRAVLGDCRELVLLKQAIRNTAMNRAAGAGVLVVPSAMGGDEVDMGDGTMVPKNAKDIYNALTVPIKNEKAASAVTPVIVFAPPDTTSSNFFHVDIKGAALYRETGLRDECVRRIEMGLDMPGGALAGAQDSNHWSGWLIDEQKWSDHGAPVTREFVGQLYAALLAPVVRDTGGDTERVRIWYDASEVVQDPDRAHAASDAFDRMAISYAAYREATGWEESDAPSPEELKERATAKKPTPQDGAPGGPLPQSEPVLAPTSANAIVGMAEACVLRCRELAGSRLRTRVQGDVSKGAAGPNLAVRMRGSPNHEIACRLGDDVRASADPDALVAGAGQVFLAGMIRMGLEPSLAETLVRRAEEHAARTLFDEDPGALPDEVLGICALVSLRA